jgi:hypothetical protein
VNIIVPVEVGILIGVLVSFVLFVRLAILAKTVRSLQFQLALFLSIWTISEIPRVLNSIGAIDLSPIQLYGAMVHTVSMVAFGLFIGYRFSRFVLRGGR